MKKYKLTKGTLSRIRTTKQDIEILINEGYVLDGEVDDNNNIIQHLPIIEESDPLSELRERLVSLGCAKSTAERYKNEKTLLEKIAEYEGDNE